MERYPRARDAEFRHLVELAEIHRDTVVYDIPAGGGYLAHYLPPCRSLRQLDPSQPFVRCQQQIERIDLENLELPNESIDVIFSLAGTHHVEDQADLFRRFHHGLKPGGTFCLADVAAGSPVGRFLDQFVGRHNGTGHQGFYLRPDDPTRFEELGFEVLSIGVRRCDWQFADTEEMTTFCRLLFGIGELSPEEVLAGIERMLSWKEYPDGGVAMFWELVQVCGRKR